MSRIDIETELNSEKYKRELTRLIEMRMSVIYCLHFCYANSTRDGVSGERNFFLRMLDDILQSIISIEMLAKEGIVNTCRRELRYLVELSIKSHFIVANSNKTKFLDQVKEYENLLNSSNINPINTLFLDYFEPEIQKEFKTFTKKLYGYLSSYTHSTTHQIKERLERAESQRSIGFEGTAELRTLNNDFEKVLIVVIVFIFHSVAQYVVGDFMVDPNGETLKWYFNKSRYINLIDEKFDYKFERQDKLLRLKQERIDRLKD